MKKGDGHLAVARSHAHFNTGVRARGGSAPARRCVIALQ